jgi:predicted nucleic acid-binding protein
MTAYVDTSVILRILFREPNPVEVWSKWDRAFSSNLWRVEALRTVDRLRLSGDLSDEQVADLIRDIRVVHETLAIHPLTERILRRASETFPTVVGTLDAIHLATALAIREVEPVDLLLTHDVQLGTAARSLGFSVLEVRAT